jgi:uncharacterized protein (DUF1330 family)
MAGRQMSAYLVGHITVRDDQLWQAYVAGVQKSLVPFACKLLFRGRRTAVLSGSHLHDLVVVIEFQDQATLEDWYASESYQSLIPLRNQAADVVLISYQA